MIEAHTDEMLGLEHEMVRATIVTSANVNKDGAHTVRAEVRTGAGGTVYSGWHRIP